jgi:hypothetical protein
MITLHTVETKSIIIQPLIIWSAINTHKETTISNINTVALEAHGKELGKQTPEQ